MRKVPPDEIKVQQNVSLAPWERNVLRRIADETAGGNVSLVVRRLIRAESARYEHLIPSQNSNSEQAA